MAKLRFQRYRVYPPQATGLKARSFGRLGKAIEFAERAVIAQGIVAKEQVQIVFGSGSDFRVVGFCDTVGFHETSAE